MIFNWEHMEKLVNKNYSEVEYDMPVFCEKHRVVGTLAYREGGKESLQNVQKAKPKKQLDEKRRAEIDAKLAKKKESLTIALRGPQAIAKIRKIKELVAEKFMSKA